MPHPTCNNSLFTVCGSLDFFFCFCFFVLFFLFLFFVLATLIQTIPLAPRQRKKGGSQRSCLLYYGSWFVMIPVFMEWEQTRSWGGGGGGGGSVVKVKQKDKGKRRQTCIQGQTHWPRSARRRRPPRAAVQLSPNYAQTWKFQESGGRDVPASAARSGGRCNDFNCILKLLKTRLGRRQSHLSFFFPLDKFLKKNLGTKTHPLWESRFPNPPPPPIGTDWKTDYKIWSPLCTRCPICHLLT